AVERTACFTGAGDHEPWGVDPAVDGSTVTFRPGHDLEPGEGLQVVAGMPGGSLPDAQPILAERYTAGRVLGTNPVSGGLGAAVLALGSALAVGLVRRAGDRQFAGVPAGEVPDGSGPLGRAPHRRADRSPQVRPVPEPPSDVTPGQLGVLVDATADQQDVTATEVDLAVRGHLRIEEYGTGEDGTGEDGTGEDGTGEESTDDDADHGWKLVRTPSDG